VMAKIRDTPGAEVARIDITSIRASRQGAIGNAAHKMI
jgi:hypothetical protein